MYTCTCMKIISNYTYLLLFFSRLVMFLRVLFLTIILPIFSFEILKYTVEEKSPRNTLVADLSKELNIKSNGFYQIYELLPLNKYLFSIDNQTGHLIITSILDREQMCLKQQCSCKSCEIVLQLFIKIKNKIIYKIIEIKIKDRNDHSPMFDRQTMIHIIHIKENVPLGYRIVLPSANDPDEGMLLTLFIHTYICIYIYIFVYRKEHCLKGKIENTSYHSLYKV